MHVIESRVPHTTAHTMTMHTYIHAYAKQTDTLPHKWTQPFSVLFSMVAATTPLVSSFWVCSRCYLILLLACLLFSVPFSVMTRDLCFKISILFAWHLSHSLNSKGEEDKKERKRKQCLMGPTRRKGQLDTASKVCTVTKFWEELDCMFANTNTRTDMVHFVKQMR